MHDVPALSNRAVNEHLMKRLAEFEEIISRVKQEFQGIVQSENHHDAIRRAKEAIRMMEKL